MSGLVDNMLKSIIVPPVSEESQESACPFCQIVLRAGEHAVQCSECKSLYHVDCWIENNNRCAVLGCSGQGKAEVPLPPSEETLQIEIIQPLLDSATADQQNPVEVEVNPVPNSPSQSSDQSITSHVSLAQETSSSLDEAVLPEDIAVELVPNSASSPNLSNSPIEEISIDNWEMILEDVAKRTKINAFLQKTHLEKLVKQHLDNKYYYIFLGMVLGISLTVVFICVILLVSLLG